MLRYVFRIHRQRLHCSAEFEAWVEYLQRSAHTVDKLSENLGMQHWLRAHRTRKWRLAGRLANEIDNRWSQQIISWKPNFGIGRSPGAPKTRWIDQIEQFAGGGWFNIAEDQDYWRLLEHAFANL